MNGGTLNLEHMIANLQPVSGDNTVNLTASIANIQMHGGGDTLNMNTGNIVNLSTPGTGGWPSALAINDTGSGNILEGGATTSLGPISVNIAPNRSLLSSAYLDGTNVSITGGTLVNNGTIVMNFHGEINSATVGVGTIEFTGWHDAVGGYSINGASGPGQTYFFGGPGEGSMATVTHPDTFHSTVDFGFGGPSLFTLMGLSADNYDIKNDLLTLYQDNNPVYQLAVKDIPSAFYVESGGGSVSMGEPFYGLPPPTNTLPLHTGA
jgi:hypothetical protein